ncbi:MAG: SDR family NAD(P)-dependent oxidoreductase [Rhizobiaceae bacterium]
MKRALVTGGNRGIGFAIAEGLKARGVDVIIGARDPVAGQSAAEKISCSAVELDVSSADSIDRAVGETGPFDILVNNAGVLFNEGILQSPDHFAESMAVMVGGPYMLVHACAPAMAAAGYGRIVNVSSGWGSFAEGLGGPGAYGVAKAALNALTLAISRELPRNVKVNAMCPGWVRTRMGGATATLSPAQGADTAIWLATLPDDGPTGGLFRERKPVPW